MDEEPACNTALFLSQEDPLEAAMATHSSILAWRIPWTEKPSGLVHKVTKSRTQLKLFKADTHTHTHGLIRKHLTS